MFLKRNRKPRRGRKLLFVLLLQFCIVGAILFFYSFSTQFTVLALILSKELDIPIGSMSVDPIDYDRLSDSWASLYIDDDSSGSSGSGSGLIIGESGAAGMLINKMQGGMYKEMLEIVREHCNWEYMHPEVPPQENEDGEVYPTVVGFLGTLLCETTVQSNKMPWATLSADAYEDDGKHTLSMYNSQVIREESGATISSVYKDWGGLRCSWSVNDRTHMYFMPENASIYPNETYNGYRWPSLMNGYGISEGTIRTKADTDAGYFPDQVSIALQVGWCAVGTTSSFDTSILNNTMFDSIPYYIYNCGSYGAPYTCGVGTGYRTNPQPVDARNWHDSNTLSFSTVASMGFIEMAGPIEQILEGMLTNYEEITAGIWDEDSMSPLSLPDYTGMAACAIKLTQDMFTTPNRETAWHNWIAGSNGASFIRGATIAYRAITGEYSTTMDEVRAFMDDIEVKSIDTSFYGIPYEENAMWGTGSNQIDYYWYSQDCEVYNSSGAGPKPALRAGGFRSRGPYAVMIGGVYLYMHMLRYAGVECTWSDAYADANGLLIERAPDPSAPEGSAGGGSSTTVKDPTTGGTITVDNTSLAAAAVSYAWPSTSAAKGNNGTALYQYVKNKIIVDDYYRSCDRGVAIAVRWSGYDDTYPAGPCTSQEAHVITSAKWQEVDWGGDVSKLKPGDILIATPGTWGDHTVMYVGYDIPKQIQGVTANVVEASLTKGAAFPYHPENRSPGLTLCEDGWIGQLTLYRVFRNVQTETNSIYVNIPIDLE